MAFELGARGEGDSAEHVFNVLRVDGPAIVTTQDVSSKFDVLVLPSGAVKLDQRHLYFRMSGDDRLLIRTRTIVWQHKVVDHPLARVHQRGISGCSIISDR